jgi:hypothetical protein
MKSIASFETTVQVSEDSWRVIRHALEVDENTTIGQIEEWSKTKPGAAEVRGELRFSITPLDSMPHIKKESL